MNSIIDPKRIVREHAEVNPADPAGTQPPPKKAARLGRRRVMVLGFVSGESANLPPDRNMGTSGAD